MNTSPIKETEGHAWMGKQMHLGLEIHKIREKKKTLASRTNNTRKSLTQQNQQHTTLKKKNAVGWRNIP